MEIYFLYLKQYSLLIDAGLVVLIWMVQLIIYPSFLYYKKENLVIWHNKYTSRIALIVIPLMLYQLVFSLMLIIYQFSLKNSVYTFLVVFLWIYTFTVFVPLHNKISNSNYTEITLQKLVFNNRVRTFLWSFLLVFRLLLM
ncbi:hypothetical protein [Polaribacter porphyrae]|uniref:DUF4149 domain-containing protein n=1 Tax=Polaribacter porphyrae TaxID=1137780 RepID=A0A2S7WT26_9FLAO|nr:hypothetical protein [Polaribacter porphyrae]PQJ80472.1 hypothetical protein BTO18_15400 [Polaribacter porphyrae]